MVRQPSRQAVLAVRAVKVAAATAVAGLAMMLTLGGATASSADVDEPEVTMSDARCTGAAGKAIVRSHRGMDRAVPFEHGWQVYRGERPGTLVVVCPS